MKKILACLVFVSLVAVSTGCASKNESVAGSQDTNAKTDSVTFKKADETQEAEKEIEAKENEKEESEQNSEQEEPGKVQQEAVVYYKDDNAVVQSKTVMLDALNADTLWQELIDAGSVPADSTVLSMSIDDENRIQLDVNQSYGDLMRSYGTSGEYMLLQCVVNSYLDSFSCDQIMITEEGQTLASNHAVYDEYLGKQN